MAQQEEPLYDFPEPTQPSDRKFSGHQRGQGSLRSISILDRLLLTVPVWLQLSINPATALHILQREPPAVRAIDSNQTNDITTLLNMHTHVLPPPPQHTHTLSRNNSDHACCPADRPSWFGSPAHPRETCSASAWPMRACRSSSSSLGSRRSSPVRA